LAEAGAQYEAALRINPQLSVTHNNLGVLLFKLGDAFGVVIAARPGYDEAHYNLAVALASRGSMEEA
jgi:lipoprotein NlpI